MFGWSTRNLFVLPGAALLIGLFSISICLAQNPTPEGSEMVKVLPDKMLKEKLVHPKAEEKLKKQCRRNRIKSMLSRTVRKQNQAHEQTEAPVMVYPYKKGFDDLHEAFDFCREQNLIASSRGAAWNTVILDRGMYVGNFILPANTFVLGKYGPFSTTITQEDSTSLPVIDFETGFSSNPNESALIGLTVISKRGDCVSMDGPAGGANGGLFIHDCEMMTGPDHPSSVIEMNGFGNDEDSEFWLYVSNTNIDSISGTGINAVLGQFSDIDIYQSDICGSDIAIRVDSSARDSSVLTVERSDVNVFEEDSNAAIKANGLRYIAIEWSYVSSDGGNCLHLTDIEHGSVIFSSIFKAQNTGDAMIIDDVYSFKSEHCEICVFYSPSYYSAVINNETYAEFNFVGAISGKYSADSSSSVVLNYCY